MYRVKVLLEEAIILEQSGYVKEAISRENEAENLYNKLVNGNLLSKHTLYDLFGLKGFH